MATIVIKKRVELGFLGDDYKDDYLVFKSMPLRDYEKLLPELESASDNGQESLKIIKKVLEDNYLDGKFQGEAVVKEDLADFDLVTLTKCFEIFTGQVADPKVPSP